MQQYASDSTGVTRADLWALAAVVAVDVGNHVQVTTPVSFIMPWYGRQTCEMANTVCLNASGQSVPCAATQGPHRDMPSVNLNTAGIFSFFANEFGFSQRETVAIMGAHNVGKLVRTVRIQLDQATAQNNCYVDSSGWRSPVQLAELWNRRTRRVGTQQQCICQSVLRWIGWSQCAARRVESAAGSD